MSYPSFFDKVPTIRLHDELGGFLGAFADGEIEISYYDCAKLAGHSCPTVASAYIMAYMGLTALYADSLPERSQIKIESKNSKDEGVTGVIANVISYIIGANDESGFKGIGGKFARNNLVTYGVKNMSGSVKLTRLDTGASATLSSDTSVVPGSSDMMPLMQKSMQDIATPQEQQRFRELWQSRVETMLLDQKLWQKIVTVIQKDD